MVSFALGMTGKIIRVDVVLWNGAESHKIALGRVATNIYSNPNQNIDSIKAYLNSSQENTLL